MNITSLRNKLASQFEKLEKREIPIDSAREISRTSQSILESIRLELEYNKFMNVHQKIEFLENGD